MITLYASIISGNYLRLSIGIITYLLRSCSFMSVQSVNTQFVNGSLFVFKMQTLYKSLCYMCKHHLILVSSPRSENWNLLVRFKILIYFYIVLNKNWKIYWSEQSFTGLRLEDPHREDWVYAESNNTSLRKAIFSQKSTRSFPTSITLALF